ncbi:hydroxymyristoyl-ACP dehydratase [Serratia sp. Leaf50]|uniref:ApeI family dehydratase n=1 Tax=Rouxiella sp. S1S-2 TaxID=2653856 RepID=UPI0006F280C6|nr:hydroxymyristoyl-ACP dehydratase [Rouxiella sp. S1S-2]KAB7895549.1 hydroxymyristoyl-ACP dehydratase [Rouxiella sp. S1S-2]KQN44094.1 hydroxymyristoyl-ACP dehydratase [Serratia sp. Leaf50]
MMQPKVLNKHNTDTGVTLELMLPAELFWFQGHFPGQPILPGVTQLHWVMEYARQELALAGEFAGFDVLKFQQPLLPEQRVTLTLHWLAEKNKLTFNYQVGDRQASSGKINLC